MLGLQHLDGDGQGVKRILSPAKDWIELEERRRTFWASFYGDRWSSSGTGWPMIIDEKDVGRIYLLMEAILTNFRYKQIFLRRKNRSKVES
jgi:hypothetical protein